MRDTFCLQTTNIPIQVKQQKHVNSYAVVWVLNAFLLQAFLFYTYGWARKYRLLNVLF